MLAAHGMLLRRQPGERTVLVLPGLCGQADRRSAIDRHLKLSTLDPSLQDQGGKAVAAIKALEKRPQLERARHGQRLHVQGTPDASRWLTFAHAPVWLEPRAGASRARA